VGALNGAELPEGVAKARAVREMFDTIAPRYDLVNRIITFGLDRKWRKTAVESLLLHTGSRVLDVACGTGDLCIDLASRGHQAVGIDLSIGMISHARTAAPLVQTDALEMPFPSASFDGAVSGFALRNVVSLDALFKELARVVRPGGRISLLDVETPANPVLRAGHAIYFGHVVPRVGSLLSDRGAYRYLPRSVAYLPPAETTLSLLRQAGFADARRRLLNGGITQLITASRSPTGGVP
jgi:demethylmenaquinone methyltransferase / 2-methoxy-6-polyprenyl-1,4-benzoquinol methylase